MSGDLRGFYDILQDESVCIMHLDHFSANKLGVDNWFYGLMAALSSTDFSDVLLLRRLVDHLCVYVLQDIATMLVVLDVFKRRVLDFDSDTVSVLSSFFMSVPFISFVKILPLSSQKEVVKRVSDFVDADLFLVDIGFVKGSLSALSNISRERASQKVYLPECVDLTHSLKRFAIITDNGYGDFSACGADVFDISESSSRSSCLMDLFSTLPTMGYDEIVVVIPAKGFSSLYKDVQVVLSYCTVPISYYYSHLFGLGFSCFVDQLRLFLLSSSAFDVFAKAREIESTLRLFFVSFDVRILSLNVGFSDFEFNVSPFGVFSFSSTLSLLGLFDSVIELKRFLMSKLPVSSHATLSSSRASPFTDAFRVDSFQSYNCVESSAFLDDMLGPHIQLLVHI